MAIKKQRLSATAAKPRVAKKSAPPSAAKKNNAKVAVVVAKKQANKKTSSPSKSKKDKKDKTHQKPVEETTALTVPEVGSGSYFNEKFDRVDQDQSFACISVVGPDVIQKARTENGDIHPVHGLVVWGTLASDSGPEADKMKAAASQSCRGLLDVYVVKSCAMLPLKFSQSDFTVANSTWADDRVEELMSGLRRSKQLTQKFFDERKEHLANNSSNEEMVSEELERFKSDLEKLDEEKLQLQKNIEVYEARLQALSNNKQ